MSNCRNCGATPSIHHNGCDYCGTGVSIKRRVSYVDEGSMPKGKAEKMLDDFWVPVERPSHNFDPRDWGYFHAPTLQWRTRCGHSVEAVRYFIEFYGEDAPIEWQNQTRTDWPQRVR